MPNAKEHIIVAAGVGIVGYAMYCAHFHREFKVGEALLATGTCVLGSLAPDGLEPALHPCHRCLGHSISAGALSMRAMTQAWTGDDIPSGLQVLLGFFALGYVSHLVIDAGTPKGLPLLC